MIEIKYDLTDSVKEFIAGAKLEEIGIGCSNSQVIKIIKNSNTYYLKMATKGPLTKEYNALKWLKGKLEVPEIMLYDFSEENEYLLTKSLDGEMTCSANYVKNPEVALKVIKEAFDEIYAVDISNCPFDVSNSHRLSVATENVKNGLVKTEDLSKETIEKYGTVENVLQYLLDNRFPEELCFSHGDSSLPNIFGIQDKFTGFIDIGECGIADKWFDIAICEKSIRRNLGEEYIAKFYEMLNIRPNKEKTNYYILMLELLV